MSINDNTSFQDMALINNLVAVNLVTNFEGNPDYQKQIVKSPPERAIASLREVFRHQSHPLSVKQLIFWTKK